MDVFPKFIVEGDCLILGKCTYHKQLAIDRGQVKGGGWWKLDRENKTLTLSGDSFDFGAASPEDIKACIESGNVFWSYHDGRRIEGHTFYINTGYEIIKLN
jgi:hypothetical protein